VNLYYKNKIIVTSRGLNVGVFLYLHNIFIQSVALIVPVLASVDRGIIVAAPKIFNKIV